MDWPLALLIHEALVEEKPKFEMRRKDKRIRRSTMRELSSGTKEHFKEMVSYEFRGVRLNKVMTRMYP